MKRVFFLSFAVLISALTCANAWGQATAQITGAVRDQSGAVLPGVELTATQIDTGISRTAITNETGSYVLTNLPIGPYRLEAALPGFRTYAQTGIVLQVNSSPVINVTLEVGQVSESIEVQANATLVETRNSGIGQVVENERILELPLNGRNVTELVALAGAAAPAVTLTGSSRDPFAQGNVSVAGGLNSGLNYKLDGADHNNPFQGSYLSMPFPDAMQEFKVETSATSAKQGGKSAGEVSLVTKSGTNAFHGDLFEFVRNGIFNARNAFAPTRDTLKRNQYGGTVGGPVLKNKLFFFGGFQGTKTRSTPPEIFAYVPTPAMLAGDFRSFASATCNNGRAITLAAPFVNNQINPGAFSAPAVKFASFLPKTDDPCGKVFYSSPTIDDWTNWIGRVDYQLSNSHSLFGRYLRETRVQPVGYDLNGNLLATDNGTNGKNSLITLGSTYLFGANVVNTARATWNHFIGGKTSADFSKCNCGNGHLGIKSYFASPDDAAFAVTGNGGGFTVNANNGPTKLSIYSFNDDVSIVHGDHQYGFGVVAGRYYVHSSSANNTEYQPTFNGRTYGLAMADFLMGKVSTWRTGSKIEQQNHGNSLNAYFADAWKLSPRITMNYGIRWEPWFPQVNDDGTSLHFDEAALRAGTHTNRFINAPPGLFFDGDPGFPNGTGYHKNNWNLAPRLGFAWDVNGDGRTSVRASAGIFYDRPTAIYFRNTATVPPWTTRTDLQNVDLADPWANYPGGDPGVVPAGGNAPKTIPWQLNNITSAYDYDTPNMRVGQYSLSVQRQVGTDFMVSANYIGNTTRHFWTTEPINAVTYIPGVGDAQGRCFLNGAAVNYTVNAGAPCSTASTASYNQRRRLSLDSSIPRSISSAFGPINRIESGGTANYNGLVLSFQRRPVKGVGFSANYTWSHCISDYYLDIANSGNANAGWTDPNNRRYDRGNCTGGAEDRRHLFNLSGTAASPQFNNRTLRLIATGWQVAPIFRIMSGQALVIGDTTDPGLIFISPQRPNVTGDPYGDGSNKNYLNVKAFSKSSAGSLGNLSRGAIFGPGRWQFDVALSRDFRFKESQRVQFRAEAFNLTNSFRQDVPTTNFNDATFGQVITALDPRIMQFALKYFF
jgi:Carboxypeptidase regulatory-like domain